MTRINFRNGPHEGSVGTPSVGEPAFTTGSAEPNEDSRLFVGDGSTAGGVPSAWYACPHPGYKSGYYYANAMPLTSYVSAAMFSGFCVCVPTYIGGMDSGSRTTSITQITINVTVAVGGSTAALAIYDSIKGEPKNRLWYSGSGAVSTATTGLKTLAVNESFPPGWYWIGCNFSAAGISITGADNLAAPPIIGKNTLTFPTSPPTALYAIAAYGANACPDPISVLAHITSDAPTYNLTAG